MRLYPFTLLIAVSLFVFTGCDKNDADPNRPILDISTDFVKNKSDRDVEVVLEMTVPGGIKNFLITKGVNLKPDADFGTDTVAPASLGDNKFRYIFHYTLQRPEIDKLVGFNFKLIDNAGRIVEKDLTVHTEANGAETIYNRRWNLTSTLRITATPAAEELDPCLKDNIYSFAKDSTMSVNYGPSCGFDGLNVHDKWQLSEDEKTFTWEYFNLFNPAQRTTEVFNVRSISSSQLVMDITIDLSWLGPPYTDKEQFVYTFKPAP
ncbi:hypothetical protein [Pseudobacter ginsenosidimutans]|uniref:Lipoprotein n=1 Tax=Pseudobacter ginsenosidimutans TaxID=661488 RepID=A0A4Q7N282_9BACT|nr:hypothetical protein [Pseudobacter ginsenosidimutans]QEC43976.1 hypothetical protein FSB84_20685 [Pseudobacter ginsenosidimutans]RZS75412.1 hypothetical protein EV199_1277 [Pseudobacter ginsenosidimutans]